jgi:hypothetical protein
MRHESHPSPSIALTADTNTSVQDTDEADHVTRLDQRGLRRPPLGRRAVPVRPARRDDRPDT